MDPKKKYGLIVPNKRKQMASKLKPRLSAFQNDESSDEDAHQEVNAQIHKEAMKKVVRKQTKIDIQKVLEEDATAYEYDTIYDDMKDKANKKIIPKEVAVADKHRKPKYIGSLLKAAESRNRERQRIEERKIEKERKMEGDTYSDKPAFVTSAYRKRMQERQQEEEEEQRKAAIEDALDVKKQKDLSGFYRHFLKQQLGEETPGSSSNEKSATPIVKKENDITDETNIPTDVPAPDDRDSDLSFESSSDDDDDEPSRTSKRDEDIKHSNESDSPQGSLHESDIKKPVIEPRKNTGHSEQNIEKSTDPNSNKDLKKESNAFKKRANSNSTLSAKERYLERKRKRQFLSS